MKPVCLSYIESEDDSSNSDNSSVEEDEEDYTDEEEKGARAERSSGKFGDETQGWSVSDLCVFTKGLLAWVFYCGFCVDQVYVVQLPI